MRRTPLFLLPLLLMLVVGTAIAGPAEVPAGEAPTIDGVIHGSEWKDAASMPLHPSGQLLVKRCGDDVYVAVQTDQRGIVSLTAMKDGKVHVLHASASLGTAVYAKKGDTWQPKSTFAWRCRKLPGSQKDPSSDERAKFFQDEAWVGTTMMEGKPGHAEFKLGKAFFPGKTPRLGVAVAVHSRRGAMLCTWPKGLEDASVTDNLLMGTCPEGLRFEPSTWGALSLPPLVTPAMRFERHLDAIEKSSASAPREAWVALSDLLAKAATEERDEEFQKAIQYAQDLRKKLAQDPETKPEVKADKAWVTVRRWLEKNAPKIESQPSWRETAKKKLTAVARKHTGTRGARLAEERLASLASNR